MFLAVGSIIIDDIVLPDGRTCMGALGGNAPHAAMGMRVWSEDVWLLAPVGRDLPEAARRELAGVFEVSGLRVRDLPMPRAWQVFEPDGRRTEVYRGTSRDYLAENLQPDELNVQPAGASVYLACDAPEPLRAWVGRLRAGGCRLILWEPWMIFARPENRQLFGELASLVDVFSPNLLEAQRLTGLKEPGEIVAAMLQAGARAVALRLGAAGSLVAGQGRGPFEVPAVRVEKIVDVTGAGNAYCGGFLAGLRETGDLLQAGRFGAVSASFAIEQFGAMYPVGNLRSRAEARLHRLMAARPNEINIDPPGRPA